jgi:hypothetical protein
MIVNETGHNHHTIKVMLLIISILFKGRFPKKNSKDDGYEFGSPVDALGPQNDFGLYNMIGNDIK